MFLQVRLTLRKESILMFCPHTQRFSPREVPESSSDTCLGLDLYLIDPEHLLPWVPGHCWWSVMLCSSLLDQGQGTFVDHIQKRLMAAPLLPAGNLYGVFIVAHFVDAF